VNKIKNILRMEHPAPHNGCTHFELGLWGNLLLINEGRLRALQGGNDIVVPYYSQTINILEDTELIGIYDGEEWDLVMVYDLMGQRYAAVSEDDTEEIETEVIIAARLAEIQKAARV